MNRQIENPTIVALRKSAVSRYIQLAGLFRQRIEAGYWAVGQKMPTVKELADECGVATMTIRQALDILEDEGLIERYRAKGTFVRARPGQDLWCDVATDWAGLTKLRDTVTIDVLENLSNESLPPHETEFGRVVPSYRKLKRRHRRADMPFLVNLVYLDERLCDRISEDAFSTETAFAMISNMPDVTVADAKQVFTIGAADLEASMLLNISIGDPVAKVKRIVVNQDNEIILLTNGTYRGDQTRLELDLIR